MGIGIQICGLNGCGKSTLGRALAKEMGFYFIDVEDLYFPAEQTDSPYTNAKSRTEVEKLLLEKINRHPNFVFAAVKGDYGEDIISKYDYVVNIEVPKNIRSQRVRNRSFLKFGDRMLMGGDLHDQEEKFFRMTDSRQDAYVEDWINKVKSHVISVDGTKTIEENIKHIIHAINMQQL